VCLIFATIVANGMGYYSGAECCSGFGKRVCQSITGKYSTTEKDLLET